MHLNHKLMGFSYSIMSRPSHLALSDPLPTKSSGQLRVYNPFTNAICISLPNFGLRAPTPSDEVLQRAGQPVPFAVQEVSDGGAQVKIGQAFPPLLALREVALWKTKGAQQPRHQG